ncbi:MAG: DUF5678 domain-containing protein [Acidobacteria bacterium]|nr:DUF5678 domain-containing protein [Acidobacteriota bacterium]
MITSTVKSILEQIASLSDGEKAELRDLMDSEEKANGAIASNRPILRLDSKDEASLRWLKAHGDEYIGQWVALDGDRLIAHSTLFDEVVVAAKADGAKLPLYHFIEPEPEYPFIRA